MNDFDKKIQAVGNKLITIFHYIALFGIGLTVVWSAVYEYLQMVKAGHATLEEILLLFIYLELGAMVGVYFKTHRLPVQFLIYIAITGLSRHLVIDVQMVKSQFQLYMLLSIVFAILMLSAAIWILSNAAKNFGCPEDLEFDKRLPKEDSSDKRESSG
jgi:phosphate starvation-inducible membrane PsiE